MNILIVDQELMGLDFALRCAANGHSVKLYRHMPKRYEKYGMGFKEIELVSDFRSHMEWAKDGLIVPTGNFTLLHELDRYREFGHNIFGPTPQSARIEIDRLAGMKAAQAAGIAVPEFHVFGSLEETEAFARKQDRGFVFKPGGDHADKAMTFVASDPAELVGWLRRQIKAGKNVKQCLLQEKVDVLSELGISGWMGIDGFLPDKYGISIEHKKLCDKERGPATGEMGCYSADTEVLTSDGWKFWPDVTQEDELGALVDGELRFECPTAVVEYDVNGPMMHWQNRSIDILVTPGHHMYVAGQSSARIRKPEFKFVQAADCTEAQYLLKRTAVWSGESPKDYMLRGNRWHNGMGWRETLDIAVPFSAWAKFLGLWFAEGSSSPRTVNIAQSSPRKMALVEAVLSALPLKFFKASNGFGCGCAALARELRPFGRSYEKRVPDYIKNASSIDIAAFLDGFAIGDAHTAANGARYFYTSNDGLASDLQELMLRCGRLGIIKRLAKKKTYGKINGREIVQRRPAYVVYERARKITGWLDKRDKKEVHYEGKVYCATVSSHVLFVRRNGKPVWCGNTLCQYAEADKLADEMLKPFEPIMRSLGHIGDFSVGAIVDKKGKAWFLETTCRCGYPAWWIQMASHRGDPCQWMLDLLKGKDSLRVSYDVAIGVVCAQPPFPYEHDVPFDMVEGNPISGIDDHPNDVHLVSVMKAKGPVWRDGKIVEEKTYETTGPYVLVCTGLGKTIGKAREKVYRVVDDVKFPDKIARDDIGEKVIECLPAMQKHGYLLDMVA